MKTTMTVTKETLTKHSSQNKLKWRRCMSCSLKKNFFTVSFSVTWVLHLLLKTDIGWFPLFKSISISYRTFTLFQCLLWCPYCPELGVLQIRSPDFCSVSLCRRVSLNGQNINGNLGILNEGTRQFVSTNNKTSSYYSGKWKIICDNITV